MCAGGNADAALPAMGYDEAPSVGGDIAYLAGFGESSNPSYIRLLHVYLTWVCQIQKLPVGVLPFPRRDANGGAGRQLSVTVQVVDIDRCFHKKDVV